MSMLPEPKPSDSERMKWENVPPDLVGRIVSLEELRATFPPDETYREIELLKQGEKYSVYGGRLLKRPGVSEPLAYQCLNCQTIMIGPPEITDENTINGKHPFTGRVGYDLYCKKCKFHLEDRTLELS